MGKGNITNIFQSLMAFLEHAVPVDCISEFSKLFVRNMADQTINATKKELEAEAAEAEAAEKSEEAPAEDEEEKAEETSEESAAEEQVEDKAS